MIILLYLLLLFVPLMSYFKLKSEEKKLVDISNKKDLSGFEIAKRIVDENVYIIEVRDTMLNTYYKSRETLKFSTRVFHSSDILSSVIASKLAFQTHKKSFLTGSLLNILDILNIVSFICFLVGVLYDMNFVILAIAIIVCSLGIILIDMISNKEVNNQAFDYLVKNKIIDEKYDYLKDIVKYEYVARIFTIIPDSIQKLFKTVFK